MVDISANRRKLLDKALNLFATRGYDAVGVQEIVEAAGVTKPSLYHYFGSKHGLLEALLTEYLDNLYAQVEQAAEYRNDLPYTIEQIIKAYFGFAQNYPLFCQMQLGLWFAPPASEAYLTVTRHNEKQYRLLKEVFTRAAAQHGNMKNRQEAYTITFIGMINTYISIGLRGYNELDEQLAHQAARQFMYGIFT
jgi:AcrR family transcriptional regulator